MDNRKLPKWLKIKSSNKILQFIGEPEEDDVGEYII